MLVFLLYVYSIITVYYFCRYGVRDGRNGCNTRLVPLSRKSNFNYQSEKKPIHSTCCLCAPSSDLVRGVIWHCTVWSSVDCMENGARLRDLVALWHISTGSSITALLIFKLDMNYHKQCYFISYFVVLTFIYLILPLFLHILIEVLRSLFWYWLCAAQMVSVKHKLFICCVFRIYTYIKWHKWESKSSMPCVRLVLGFVQYSQYQRDPRLVV